MRSRLTAAAFVLTLLGPAFAAEFYVALDTSTKECRVVTARPDDRPTLMLDANTPSLRMVGSGAYQSEAEAQKAIRVITECNS